MIEEPLPGPQYFIQYVRNGVEQDQYAVDDRDLDRIIKRIRKLGAGAIFVWKRIPTPEDE